MSGTWSAGNCGNWHVEITGSHSYPLYTQSVTVERLTVRNFCEYCHGYTKMDDNGCCVACGALKPFSGIIYA